jgi:hypothetical protein
MTADRENIRVLTGLLRSSDDPQFVRMRQLLWERGISPDTIAVADLFPDDTQFDFGLLVTRDGQAYQVGFDYLHKRIEEGIFTEWVDLTDTYAGSIYCDKITVALAMLRAGELEPAT